MDANKLLKLNAVGYKISGCCGLCLYGNFEKGKIWGTCIKHRYQHLKHTKSDREISICIFGRCKEYKEKSEKLNELGTFKRFT